MHKDGYLGEQLVSIEPTSGTFIRMRPTSTDLSREWSHVRAFFDPTVCENSKFNSWDGRWTDTDLFWQWNESHVPGCLPFSHVLRSWSAWFQFLRVQQWNHSGRRKTREMAEGVPRHYEKSSITKGNFAEGRFGVLWPFVKGRLMLNMPIEFTFIIG